MFDLNCSSAGLLSVGMKSGPLRNSTASVNFESPLAHFRIDGSIAATWRAYQSMSFAKGAIIVGSLFLDVKLYEGLFHFHYLSNNDKYILTNDNSWVTCNP